MTIVTNITQLNAAIVSAAGATSGTVTITLGSNITFSATALQAINLQPGVTLVIEGDGHTLSGSGVQRGFFVYAGTIEINNLAINNMLAQGGGGAGLGGDGGVVGFLEVNNGGGGGGGAAGSILTGVGAKARFPSLLARSMSMSQVSCASGAVSQLVFIDRGVEDHHTLLAGLAAGARALVLDPSREALVQIVEVLEACGPVEAVHIVAHGSPGELHFISGTLSHKNLPEHASALARIGCALQAGGDILLYGCDVARGEAGRSFIEKLAEITGADVAAASHPVGARGGSFDLDLRIGTIATVTPFAPRSLAAFSGLLNGGDGGGVRNLTYGGAGGTGNTGQQGGDGGYSVAGGGGGGGASGTTTGGGGGAGGHNSGGSGGSGGSGAGAAGSNGTDGTLSSSNANGGGGGGGGGGVAGNGNTGILGGSFTGGAGGDGGRGGNGAQTAGGGGGGGGAGGDGAVVTSSVLNAFTLLGGDGGDSGNGGVAAGQFLINGEGGAGGSGGIGLRVVGSGFSVTNSGSITGGNGGSGGGGFGGDGLVGESLNVVNSGTISGGVDPVNARANAITFTGGTNSIRFDHGGTSGLVGDISVTGSVNLLSLTASTLIDNSITGSGSVSKGGSNLITLSGDNSYSGGTSLNSGTLAVGGFSALGSGTLAMANGTTLQAATALTLGNAVTITGTATIDANGKGTTLNGAVSGIGTLNVTNSSGTAANVTLGNAGNAFTLGSVSLPGGDFTLVGSGSGGTLTVSGPVSATNISLTAGNNLSIAGTLTASGLTLNAAGVTTLGVSLTGIGSLETDAAGTTALNGGSVTTTAKQIYNDAVTLGRNATLTDTGAGIAFMSTVNGSFSLTTNVGWVTVFNGAVGGTTALTSLSIDGGLQTQLNGGSVRTTGAQSYHDYVVLGAATTLTSTGSGAITFEDDVKNGGFDLHVITAGAGTFDGEIFGAGKFIQGGSGTTTLSAINTYTGTTTINAGTLLVDGSITSSITSVNNGGTLGGHGTTGAVNVASGGALSPGAGAGLLTTGDLSLSSGAHFRAEIGGAAAGSSYDQVHVNGTVSLGGATLNASVINGFVPASGSFKIIDNDGNDQVTGTFAGLAEGSSFFAGAVRYAISYHGGDGNDVVLTVIPPNNPPVAVDDDDTATEDTAPNPVTGNVLANDSDPDGNALTVTSAGTFNLGHGTLVVHADGSYSYTLDNSNPAVDALNNGQTLVDSFTYGISDGQGGTRSAMLAITIHGRTDNFPPDVAGAVTLAAIAEDSGVRLITQAQLLGNVTDVDGPSLTATDLTIATGSGTLADNNDGTWSYTPALNDDTSVSFSYQVTDSFTSVADSATLDITPANDAPVAGAVTLAAIAEDSGARLITQAQLLGNVTDVDGPSLTATNLAIATGAGALVDNNDGSWSYTPALNDDAAVSFSFQVTDGVAAPVAGSATLDITPVNDAPVVTGAITLLAIAEDSGARLITQAQLLGNVTDIDGPSLTAANLAIATGSGSLFDNNDGTWSYTPALNDDTSVSFSYQITDGTTSLADSATLDITPVNDAPVVTGAVTLAAIAEDSGARLITQAQLLGNVTDVDGPSLTATAFAIATGSGSLVNNNNGTWSYTPSHNDDTAASFSWLVSDGTNSVADSGTLDITPVNDAPVNTLPASRFIVPNADVAVTGLAVGDVDSTSLTTTLHVEHGTLNVGAVGGAAVAGSGSSTVTLTGSAAQIDAVLGAANNVLYHSVFNFSGIEHLTMTSNDGSLSDTDVLDLSVFEQVQAQSFGGIVRPTLTLDSTGHIILDQPAAEFAATYGMKALYLGMPESTPYPPVAAHDFHLI